jgi:phage tail sheath protein FI
LYAPHPREGAAEVARELIAHCETTRTCFAILDGEPGAVDPRRLYPQAAIADSSRAAYYVPWLRVADPEAPAGRSLPPGGHVAGIYARSELVRGVHKAPANEVIAGAVDLESHLDDAALEALKERGVNAIRRFPGRGILVWGARTLSSDPEWRYVSVRRLVLRLEQSIAQGLRWAVFQPNDEALWRAARRAVEIFLTEAWRDGALQGARVDQAFFVRCDETTMTQADLDAGRLVCQIGVAPIKPAEFIILRIGQWTASRPS